MGVKGLTVLVGKSTAPKIIPIYTYTPTPSSPLLNIFEIIVTFGLFQSYIKETFRTRREALRSSLTEVEGVGEIFYMHGCFNFK